MKHIKTETAEYHLDDHERYQGEFKSYHDNGELCIHCFYLDDRRQGEFKSYYNNGQLRVHCFHVYDELQGEYKVYYKNGQLDVHCFYVNDKNVTDEVKPLVRDISNITQEEKLILKLQLGLDL